MIQVELYTFITTVWIIQVVWISEGQIIRVILYTFITTVRIIQDVLCTCKPLVCLLRVWTVCRIEPLTLARSCCCFFVCLLFFFAVTSHHFVVRLRFRLWLTLPMGFKAILWSHWCSLFRTWVDSAHGFQCQGGSIIISTENDPPYTTIICALLSLVHNVPQSQLWLPRPGSDSNFTSWYGEPTTRVTAQCHFQNYQRQIRPLALRFNLHVYIDIHTTDAGGSDSWMRKPRTKFSPDQLQALELEYQMDPFLSTSADKRADLAKKLNITEKNVQIWFQVVNFLF